MKKNLENKAETTQTIDILPKINKFAEDLALKFKAGTIDKIKYVDSIIEEFEQFLTDNNVAKMNPDIIRTIKGRLGKVCNNSMSKDFQHTLITDWVPLARVQPLNKIYCFILRNWYVDIEDCKKNIAKEWLFQGVKKDE
jgi:hypothetical protein